MLFIFTSLSFLITIVLIPILIVLAKKYGLVDVSEGDELKIHKKPISYLGGTALFVGVTVSLVAFGIFQDISNLKIIGLILASFLIYALGLWDDFKWKHISQVKPYIKFILLLSIPLVSSFLLYQFGIFPNSILYIFITLFYIFVLINSVNYQDGMDGLAGGFSLISFAGFMVLSLVLGNMLAFGISAILFAATLAFLIFNFPPAKIFMGDSGAYFLGFYIAILALIFSDFNVIQSVIGSIFVIGVPFFEGIFTNVRRILKGNSIFYGDRDHTYDLLLKNGYSTKKVLTIFYLIQVISISFGVWLIL